MSALNLSTRFDYTTIEQKWTSIWDENMYFHPQVEPNKKPFSIAFPPPNVTGILHMGHAANISVQDALVRGKRMQGYNTLWTVGADHAGIGTQVMVERLLKSEGTSRQELGREGFLERTWQWKTDYEARIHAQMKHMGASGDFRRARFTMDEGYSRAIRKVFVEWYNAGIIYRDNRLVNWDPASQTVLSDLEVESKEEAGHLWHIRYPLSDDPNTFITVATTRPETLVGDMAVAVHPEDERYKHLLGKTVDLPLTDRQIPIVGDAEVADPAFGSGAVKITPAHDFNDWECGKRNDLEVMQVIDLNACMNHNAPLKYQGMKVNAARKAIVEDLDAAGFLVKVEDHTFLPGRSERTGAIVQPLPLVQWWVDMKRLAGPARDAVREGRIRYVPERFTDEGVEWLEKDIRDWCISRQLWWGHQIPVWYDADGNIAYVGTEDPDPEQAKTWTRDEDVLDTWFSSALWPFATLGWPDQTPELAQFYPTSVLSTARDILKLWVARMNFSSHYFLNTVPFEQVLVHATILTHDGKRMSKSKGTGIDPFEMAQKYGVDACRFWLSEVSMSGQSVRFSEEKLQNGQHFVTKIWNACRFMLMNLEDFDPSTVIDLDQATLVDRWILSRLKTLHTAVSQSLVDFSFPQATKQLYTFIWNDFCDWYLEIAKPRLQGEERAQVQAIMFTCMDTMLRLLHPFMPFVSEELWSEGLRKIDPQLGSRFGAETDAEHLTVAAWPEVSEAYTDQASEDQMDVLMDAVRVLRNLRAEIGVPANKMAEAAYLGTTDTALLSLLQDNTGVFQALAKLKQVHIQSELPEIEQAAHGMSQNIQVTLPLAGLIDLDKEKERLQREIAKLEKDMMGLTQRLSNPKFVERAPESVVTEANGQLAELGFQKQTLETRLEAL
jgi:valyl-tRNA synthetase